MRTGRHLLLHTKAESPPSHWRLHPTREPGAGPGRSAVRLSPRKPRAEPHPPCHLQTASLNRHLQDPMDGLTARVFWTYNASIMRKRCPEESGCLCGDRVPARALVPGCWAGMRAMWSVAGVECSSLSPREWVRGPRWSPPRPPAWSPVRCPGESGLRHPPAPHGPLGCGNPLPAASAPAAPPSKCSGISGPLIPTLVEVGSVEAPAVRPWAQVLLLSPACKALAGGGLPGHTHTWAVLAATS